MIERIKKMPEFFKKKPIISLALTYAVFIVCLLAVVFAMGVFDEILYLTGGLQEKNLTLSDFKQEGVTQHSDFEMTTATNDAQLHLEFKNQQIRSLRMKCEFSTDPGEVVLFYKTNLKHGFGTHKQLYVKAIDGEYVFVLPRGVKAIRFDIGVEPSIETKFEYITLNKHSFNNSMRFSTEHLFIMLVAPALIYAVINIGIDIFEKLKVIKKPKE